MSGKVGSQFTNSGVIGKPVLGEPASGVSTNLTSLSAAAVSGVLPVGVTGGSGLDASPLNGRNMIINGDMQLFQRATGATAATGGYHTADRWRTSENSDGAYTSEKHAMSLAEINTTGHSSAIALNVTTADGTIAAAQLGGIFQRIEAQNCQHLQWGTAAAKDVTLSFWVKSKIAGDYYVMLQKSDSTSYYINKEYTINDADTWEHKTITVTPTSGSTTLITGAGGIIANDNGIGINVYFVLFAGSNFHATTNTWATAEDYATSDQVNWMSSTDNDFYLTGVQFEAGSVATPFEYRSFGDELAKCQRYYEKNHGGCTNVNNISYSAWNISFAVHKRAAGTTSIHSTLNDAADNAQVNGTSSNITAVIGSDLDNPALYLEGLYGYANSANGAPTRYNFYTITDSEL
jgi:hypothetical protein